MLSEDYKADGEYCKFTFGDDGLPTPSQLSVSHISDKIDSGYYKLEDVPCEYCLGSDFEELSLKDRWGVPCRTVICKSCGLIQLNPRMTSESYKRFYNEEFQVLSSGKTESCWEESFLNQCEKGKKIASFIGDFYDITNSTFVVDVGCGTGGVLKHFKDSGCTVKGVDLGEEFITKSVLDLGLDLEVGELSDIVFSKKADIIIYNHSLEHIVNVSTELSVAKEVLSDDGILLIVVPTFNLNKFDCPFTSYVQICHPYLFTLPTLANFINRAGLNIVHLRIDRGNLWYAASPSLKHNHQLIMKFLNKVEDNRAICNDMRKQLMSEVDGNEIEIDEANDKWVKFMRLVLERMYVK